MAHFDYDPIADYSGAFLLPTTLDVAENLLSANQQNVETNTTGFDEEGNGSISRVISQSHNGAASLKTESGTFVGDGMRTVLVAAEPALTYTASVWVKGNSGNEALELLIQFYDGDFAWLGEEATSFLATSPPTWKKKSASMVAPAGTEWVALAVRLRVNYGIFYTDDHRIEAAPEVAADPVFIYLSDLGLKIPLSVVKQRLPFRREPAIDTSGTSHKPEGTIQGWLGPRNEDGSVGTEVGARDWMERLVALYASWAAGDITVALESRWLRADEIAFPEEPDITLLDADKWGVSIPWSEV